MKEELINATTESTLNDGGNIDLMSEICQNCKYWVPRNREDRFDSDGGECRKCPPGFAVRPELNDGGGFEDSDSRNFPLTRHDEWCGSFEPVDYCNERGKPDGNRQSKQRADAYVIETLLATGWKRAGDLYWRLSDAKAEADKRIREHARACRVLPVSVGEIAILSVERDCDD